MWLQFVTILYIVRKCTRDCTCSELKNLYITAAIVVGNHGLKPCSYVHLFPLYVNIFWAKQQEQAIRIDISWDIEL